MKRVVFAVTVFAFLLSAFGCASVSAPEDFVVSDGVLIRYTGRAGNAVVPDGVSAIGEEAFTGRRLRSVAIPDSVRTIRTGAFTDCPKLTSVSLPDNGIILESMCFRFCPRLTDMPIPDSADLRDTLFVPTERNPVITPSPKLIRPGGQINEADAVSLCNMMFTDAHTLRLTFVQPMGDTGPDPSVINGGAFDGTPGFTVVLYMEDGAEISPDVEAVQADYDRSEYRYVFMFTADKKPKSIEVIGENGPILLDGVTWREYESW